MAWKIRYQPAARVWQDDRATRRGRPDERQANVDREHFATKWQEQLSKRAQRPDELFRARERGHRSGTILVVGDGNHHHDGDADAQSFSGIPAACWSRWTSRSSFGNADEPRQPRATLQQLGVEVLAGRLDLDAWLQQDGQYLDWVLFTRHDTASRHLARVRRATQARVLCYARDTGQLNAAEQAILRSVDRVLVPDADEAATVRQLAPLVEVSVLAPSNGELGTLSDGSPEPSC